MEMIDPVSLKIIRNMKNIRKCVIKKHKRRKNEKYEKLEAYVSLNDIKSWFKYYPWSSVTLTINQLQKEDFVTQAIDPPKKISEFSGDDKMFTVTSKGWSSLRSYYINLFLMLIIPTLSLLYLLHR